MKYLFVVMFGLTMSAFSQSLTDEVWALKSAFASNKSDAINQALIGMQGAINQYEFVDRSPSNNPSPEKQQRRIEVKAALQPLAADLSKLVIGENPTLAANSAVILGFSDGRSPVNESLEQSLKQSPYSSVASSSAYSMFQLGLADLSFRTAIVARLRDYQNESKRDVAFGLLNIASAWPIPEALPVIVEILKSNEKTGTKMVAINALIRLGPQAQDALPEIERLRQELERNGGDFRDINTIKRAIMLVSGRGDPPQAAMPTATPSQEQTPSPKPTAETKSPSGFPIVPVAIIGAVIVGIVLYLLRRKLK